MTQGRGPNHMKPQTIRPVELKQREAQKMVWQNKSGHQELPHSQGEAVMALSVVVLAATEGQSKRGQAQESQSKGSRSLEVEEVIKSYSPVTNIWNNKPQSPLINTAE